MLKEERFANIIEYLKQNNTASVAQLAEINDVSVDTVRRDLEILESYGTLDRVHGGAVWRNENLAQNVYDVRTTVNNSAKAELAGLVEKVLEDGATVMLNSGSTGVEIAKVLAERYRLLTVITNDIDIVRVLSSKKRFRIIMLGGMVDKDENATYGSHCEREVLKYHADVGIFSVNSITPEKGVRDFRVRQIETYRAMIDVSSKVVIASDASKFTKNACMELCELDDIDCIISDSGMNEEIRRRFIEKGIDVIVP